MRARPVGGAPARRRLRMAPPRRGGPARRSSARMLHCLGVERPRLTRFRMLSDDTPAAQPDRTVSVREVFGIDLDLKVPAYAEAEEHVPDLDPDYIFDRETTLAILAGLRPQPPRDGHRLSRHRQVDPYRAGRRPPELALHPDQPRQPRLAHRPRRQGRDRPAGRQAGHRLPGRHPALGAAEQRRPRVRRVRCRPPGRDVRDPARAGAVGPPDAARPEARHPPAPGLPAVRHRQHGRPRRHVGPLSRHAADQPGPDGPLVDRHHAELPAARPRGRHRAVEGGRTTGATRAATSSTGWCAWRTSPATPS